MACPVCGGGAKIIASSEDGIVTVRCPIDGDFEVAEAHLEKLSNLNMGARHLILNAAILLSTPGRPPRIATPAFDRGSVVIPRSLALSCE